MAVKILIRRKVKPSKERELNETVKELRSKAIHAQGYISGEALCSIEDPSVHLVISTWKSLEDWNHWADSPERKAFQQKTDAMLAEPTKITPYRYESISLLTWTRYSLVLSLASRMSNESVTGIMTGVSLLLLRSRCLSDYRSARCGVCIRLKSKNR